MYIEPKTCACCNTEHTTLETLRNVVDLAEYFKHSASLGFYLEIATHQGDCLCGSTLFVQEISHAGIHLDN